MAVNWLPVLYDPVLSYLPGMDQGVANLLYLHNNQVDRVIFTGEKLDINLYHMKTMGKVAVPQNQYGVDNLHDLAEAVDARVWLEVVKNFDIKFDLRVAFIDYDEIMQNRLAVIRCNHMAALQACWL